jgi:hypothetical protein
MMDGAAQILQIRYCPKFKWEDTLLFAGSRDEIESLRSFFHEWSGDELDLIEYLRRQVTVHLFSVSALFLRRDIEQDCFVWDRGKGTWSISEAHQEKIVSLLDGLVKGHTAGHQYLEGGGATVQIMVSRDENYPLPEVE